MSWYCVFVSSVCALNFKEFCKTFDDSQSIENGDSIEFIGIKQRIYSTAHGLCVHVCEFRTLEINLNLISTKIY